MRKTGGMRMAKEIDASETTKVSKSRLKVAGLPQHERPMGLPPEGRGHSVLFAFDTQAARRLRM